MPLASTFTAPPPDCDAFMAWKADVDERRQMEDRRRATEDARRRREDTAIQRRAQLASIPASAEGAGLHPADVPPAPAWTDLHGWFNNAKLEDYSAAEASQVSAPQAFCQMCLTVGPAESVQPEALPLHILAFRGANCPVQLMKVVVAASQRGWNWRSKRGKTAGQIAASVANRPVLEALARAGADLDILVLNRGNEKQSILDLLLKSKKGERFEIIQSLQKITNDGSDGQGKG